MIAPRNSSLPTPSLESLHQGFLALLPQIELHGSLFFRYLRCPHRKEDALQEMRALAWKWYVAAVSRGKDPARFVTTLATYAARHVRSGRKLCGTEAGKDALSPLAQQRHAFAVGKLPDWETLSDNPLTDALADNTQTPVEDQVDEALPPAREGLAIRTELLGEEDPDAVEALQLVGIIYKAQGASDRALPFYRRVQELQKRLRGEDHPDHAISLDNLGLRYQGLGDHARAEQAHRRALGIFRRVHGEEHVDCALCLNNLGVLYCKTGDYRQAEQSWLEALRIQRKIRGEDHLETMITLDNLGRMYRIRGDYPRAERCHLQALEVFRKRREQDPLHYAIILDNLADLYAAQNDLARAELPAREAAAVRRRELGLRHPQTVAALTRLSALYDRRSHTLWAEGKFAEALEPAKQRLAIDRELFGPAHARVADALGYLATLQEGMEDFAAARRTREEVFTLKTRLYGGQDWRVTDARLALADSGRLAALTRAQRRRLKEAEALGAEVVRLHRQGKWRDALPRAQQSLDICKELLGAKHPAFATALSNLAGLYEKAEDPARAEPLYRQACAICKEALREGHPKYATAVNRLIDLLEVVAERCERQEDFAPARRARAEVLQLRVRLLGEKHYRVTDAHLLLARVEHRARLDPGQRRRLTQAGDLHARVLELQHQGRYREALPLAEQALKIREELLDEGQPEFSPGLNNLASLCAATGDYARAEKYYQRALEVDKKVRGESHPSYAVTLNNLAVLYWETGDYARAEPLYHRACAIAEKTRGREHADYAQALHNLAVLYRSMGRLEESEKLHRQALEIREKALGKTHRDYAQSLHSLAELYQSMGNFTTAERLYREAADRDREVLGESHPSYATDLHALGVLYWELGDFARAEPLFQRCLAIYKDALGEAHPFYASTVLGLALVYQSMGDYAQAELLYQRILASHKKAARESDPGHASVLSSLALLYKTLGEYDRAEPLYQQTLAIRKKTLGKKHPKYAETLNNLGMLYASKGACDRAEPYLRSSLRIRKEAQGETHPDYALVLNNLETLYRLQGDYDRAEPLAREVLDVYRHALGENYPDYARALHNLAAVYRCQGAPTRAEPLARQALEVFRRHLDLTSAVQSDRQQLAALRQTRIFLDSYLSLAPEADLSAEQVYQQVLLWKGTVFARQQAARDRERLIRELYQPELFDLYNQLDRVSRELAGLALSLPGRRHPEAVRRQIQKLTEEQEQLERKLAGHSSAFGCRQALRQLTPQQLQAALPADTALVDFLHYNRSRPPRRHKGDFTREDHLTAFVVRPRAPIVQVDLGPAEPIQTAVERWRKHLGVGRSQSAAAELRRLIWGPLEPTLEGVQTVLVSPDGALARLPLAALPGARPGSYLLEERALTVVPVPQLLPDLLDRRGSFRVAEPSLLLVGDVDFDAAPGRADEQGASRSGVRGRQGEPAAPYSRLPGTRDEVAALEKAFQNGFPGCRVEVLRRGQATERAVREQAPRHRWLHFATHGFFAPAELQSALAPEPARSPYPADQDLFSRQGVSGIHPGLLSGLVLAGANRRSGGGGDDGLLTALEVAALDLSEAEVVVLSACETGLGKSAGGEGLLGLQRAFQVAGARSVVASSWKVPDRATQALMERFYDNLWRRNLSRAEALRQAQLWMLREGRRRLRAEEHKEGLERGGLVREDLPGPDAPLPPFYWAAFVLSGDWR